MSSIAEGLLYPSPPAGVPKDLAGATPRYRRHAWLAMLGLVLFAALYLALTGWFGWSAYRIFKGQPGVSLGLFDIVKGLGCGFLAVFMIKGLFFRKASDQGKEFEVTQQDQPKLFEFLHKLADETSAPRPHKVFLSPNVNACVFYDLSILNFLFPSRKNLEIGLGLINVLSISELKAVLAHEFGHFAQNSMAVGRWVYMAQQVATQLIFHRDFLDSFLNGLSRFDLRIAWIGWILRLVVWSIRSVLDTALSGVMLAHRALSREMEFQADLVAVSSTGSDALVHALFRLSAADQAWSETTSFVNEELEKGVATRDLFAIQSRILAHNRRILNDPEFGEVPGLPAENREQHRVFTVDLAQPPQMWATHPQNHLREANAKKTYVPAELMDTSAWQIFDDSQKLRENLSAHVLEGLEAKPKPIEESLATLDKDFDREHLKTEYRGAYLGRSVVAHAATVAELYDEKAGGSPQELYPESLTGDLEKHRNLEREEALLTALRDRHLEPPGGIIRFRGRVIKRGDLGEAIETVQADLSQIDTHLRNHDLQCRSVHRRIALRLGGGWDDYLEYLLGALHYADHNLRNIIDANGLVENTWAVITADGNISQSELGRFLTDCGDLQRTLAAVYNDRERLVLDRQLAERLNIDGWSEALEPFRLGTPDAENLGQWMEAVQGWLAGAGNALSGLRGAALEELLRTEAQLAELQKSGTAPDSAPKPGTVPTSYRTLVPGQERALQTKLNWWDSFQTASGPVAATLRFAVSFAIVAGAVYITLPKANEPGPRTRQGAGDYFEDPGWERAR